MFDIKRLRGCRNIEDTLILIETLEKAHSDLKNLDMEKEISNSTIVGMVEERLPEDIMEKWVEIVTGDDRINIGCDKFPALMKLLLQFKECIEYRKSGMRKSEQKKIVNVADGRVKREINHDMSSKRPWCWLHPRTNDHPIWRCKLFESKSGTEKMELLRSNNACFSCLTVGHRMIHGMDGYIAEHEHAEGGHLGVAASVARVRLKYWIIKVFNMMKSIRFRCVTCRKKQRLLCRQQMADLPVERLTPLPPFYNIGVDYFGPFIIKGKVKRIRGKCFGVVFTCFLTRAVHIDLSFNYSTDAFLQKFRRFVALRGWPKRLHSDNGTSLVATSKELREAIANLDQRRLQEFGVTHGSRWTFSSADAPWMNGITESLVKTIKRCFKVTIVEHYPSVNYKR